MNMPTKPDLDLPPDKSAAEPRGPVMILTVGGTHAPVISAIRQAQPYEAWLVVSDGRDDTRSSRETAERIRQDCGNVTVRILEVPADDPDRILARCSSWLSELRQRFPVERVIADYTGGTKSMSAGLLLAALGQDQVDVQFMTGQRPDLRNVAPGTEAPKTMSADYLLAERELRRIAALFSNHDYSAAYRLCKELSRRLETSRHVPGALRNRVQVALRLNETLANWDNFSHGSAARMAEADHLEGKPSADILDRVGLLEPLSKLGQVNARQSSWLRCADLWLNAQRCARRRRYDDAVARLYRLTEAAVQAQLWERHRIPNPVPWEVCPNELKRDIKPRKLSPPSHDLHASLGLERLIEFLKLKDAKDALILSFDRGKRPDWTSRRNNSILAHGFVSLDEATWNTCSDWVRAKLRPHWQSLEPPQLPTDLLSLLKDIRA